MTQSEIKQRLIINEKQAMKLAGNLALNEVINKEDIKRASNVIKVILNCKLDISDGFDELGE